MMKRLINDDKSVTHPEDNEGRNRDPRREPAMKRAIVVALAIVVLPLNVALANEKVTPSPSAASAKSNHQILPADVLVKNILLPAWRATFVQEMKGWHKKGAAALDQVSVQGEDKQEPFAETVCEEIERVAPLAQDHPYDSDDRQD
jgi:hypothetical protein